ncbi:MAG TPA: MBL fold metallo-hydrolase [Candidatus Limnocylindria bacterium]|nr:MBL fold metallo-hydrolase [Candidatus Limnocylindria bacterium]
MTSAAAPWTDLGGGVLVRRSAAFQMNSVALLDGRQALLVDPGVLPSELDDVARAVRETRPEKLTLFMTHAHWDHVLGRAWWPASPVIAHDRFAAAVAKHRDHILGQAREWSEKLGERWERGFEPFRPETEVAGLHFMKLEPWLLVFRDALGHHDTQLSLHLPDRRILIAADMLSDVEGPILNRPAAIYRRTLAALLPLAEHGAIETLIPGHGSVALGRDAVLERLRRDLGYLDQLEDGVRAARREGLDLEDAQSRLAGIAGDSSDAEARANHLANVEIEYCALGTQPAARRNR